MHPLETPATKPEVPLEVHFFTAGSDQLLGDPPDSGGTTRPCAAALSGNVISG